MTEQLISFGFGPVPFKCLGCAFLSHAFDYHGKRLPQSCGATETERYVRNCENPARFQSPKARKDIHEGLEMNGILGADWFDK